MRELELDPGRVATVVFDMLEAYRPAIERAGTVAPVQRLLAGVRAAGAPVFWARADHRTDGADFAGTLTDIASTAYDARDKDFQVVVVRDGCHGFAEQRNFLLDRVFPRMCRVRTVDEVLAALPGGTA